MLIPLEQLEAHPHNANVMSEPVLAKLVQHMRESGHYPSIVVRPLKASGPRSGVGDRKDSAFDPPISARYQILDGHHRVIALRRLGHTHARCDVWHDIDDTRAALLLLTLNRLHGEDDPHRRGDLLVRLSVEVDMDRLARLLPDDAERIERLIALTRPPLVPPPTDEDLPAPPHAITFFLDEFTHRRLLQRLRAIDADRNRALALALGLHDSADMTNDYHASAHGACSRESHSPGVQHDRF